MWTVPPLQITDEEREELERRARAHTSPVRVARRARIILLAAEGLPNRQVARRVGIKESYVSLWRRRFAAEGLAGLEDRPRPGRPRKRPAPGSPAPGGHRLSAAVGPSAAADTA
ncbi:MAG TPA: helix-turn-helix domain-containing protein [Acidimicrobiales bacterium]|nr:helix-turn-helix domain-containing protein [Acidimicrobiales bacterium]